MTNEEALNICRLAKEAIAIKHDPKNDANEVESMMRKMQEQIAESADLNYMIAAIEKQIPKKPNKKELTEQQIASRMFMLAEHYYCTCGHPVSIGQPACDNCGQRLDWRDADE